VLLEAAAKFEIAVTPPKLRGYLCVPKMSLSNKLRDRCDRAAQLDKAGVEDLLADMERDRIVPVNASLRAQGYCASLSAAAIAWILNWGRTNKDRRQGPDWIKAAGHFMKVEALAADAAMFKSLSLTDAEIGRKLNHANSRNQPGKREAETLAKKTRDKARKAAKSEGGL
jgi:hypothetical protein